MSLKSHPGGSLGAGVAQGLPKAPQGGLQVPPEAQNDTKMVTKWDQKWSHNSDRETCSTTEQQRDQREAVMGDGSAKPYASHMHIVYLFQIIFQLQRQELLGEN